MTKIPEAMARLFNNVFICKRCKSRIRSDPSRIAQGKVVCRRCHMRNFRAKTKERRAAA